MQARSACAWTASPHPERGREPASERSRRGSAVFFSVPVTTLGCPVLAKQGWEVTAARLEQRLVCPPLPGLPARMGGEGISLAHSRKALFTWEFTESCAEFNPVDATPSDRDHLFLEVVFMRLEDGYGLSAVQRTEIWRRWKAGESLHEIGRALGKDHGSIHFLLSQHGGIVPAVRRRSERTLTLAEREEISRGIASGASIREIARNLQRAASTVSREVARHGGRPRYRASKADHQAWNSALRPRPCLLALHKQLRTIVARKLILNWSPEQISGWLQATVSHQREHARVPRSHLP